MEFNFWSFFLENLDAAGGIGGYVSISIIGFALISAVNKKKLKKEIRRFNPSWTHSILGALMGAIPGCGATIVVSSLYKNKKISFGGLLACFISTLGEGSFVLLGASNEASDITGNLKAYITITLFGLISGFIFGYFYDVLGFKPKSGNYQPKKNENNSLQINKKTSVEIFIEKLGFYAIIGMSIFLAPGSIMAFWGESINIISNLTYWVSIALATACIVYYCLYRFIYVHEDSFCSTDNFKSTIYHAIIDVSMVVTYIFIGLFVANYTIDVIIGAEKFDTWMTSSRHIVILLAAIIGVIPGCGGMITVAAAFITVPNFPLAALIAAAIATSGDGIFPLIAENKKDALIVSIIGLALAIGVGYLALGLGF